MKKRISDLFAVAAMGCLLAATMYPSIATAQGTLFVEGNNVGIGTPTPSTPLHIQATNGTAKVLVEETSGTTAAREMFKLSNNGGPFFVFADNSLSQSYGFAMGGTGDFLISHQQTPGVQFRLRPSGDLTILGTLTEGSSRAIKHDIHPVNKLAILDKVVQLPISTWSYNSDRSGAVHLGPMAEDFHASFGLGHTDKGISTLDSSGVALAALQGLYDLVEQKNDDLAKLKLEVTELRRMLEEQEEK